MAKENASWITELVDTNPADNDPVAEGNDHIQMVKAVLKNSFPSTSTTAQIPAPDNNKLLSNDGTDNGWVSEIVDIKHNRYTEAFDNAGTVNGAYNIDLSTSANTIVMTNGGTITLSVSNLPASAFVQISLIISGAGTVNFPAGTVWANGVVPTPSAGWDAYTIVSWDGSTWLGFGSVNFS